MTILGFLIAGTVLASPATRPDGLSAEGPHPALAEKLRLYGQFVGEWEFDVINYKPDGTQSTGKGEWNFSWILEGRAVQDVWITPPRGQRGRVQDAREGYGTTVRFYDPKLDAWRILWIDPVHGYVLPLVARERNGEIVQEGADPNDGSPTRWIFFEITRDTFRWRAESSEDHGKTWRKEQEMVVRRKR